MKTRFARSPLVLPFVMGALCIVGLGGCVFGQACDASASASVTVHTVDGQGSPLGVEGIEWRLEGESAFQAGDCVGGQMPCEEFVAGWEVAGSIEIQVADCPESAVVVMVDEGECHVVSEQVDLEVPEACQVMP